jgi:hypothetical protein
VSSESNTSAIGPFASERALALPAAGATALQTALGVLTDQGYVDGLLDQLDFRLGELWPSPSSDDFASDEQRNIMISITEADLLLSALRITEALSVEFSWFEMVTETVQFVGDQLLELWSDAEWLVFRDTPKRLR